MASNSNLLDLSKEQLFVPDEFYEIWNNKDIPTEGIIDIITEYDENTDVSCEIFEKRVKVGELKFKTKHFVDDSGYGKYINYYVKCIERDGVKKKFKKQLNIFFS